MAVQASGVIGAQLYQASDAPRYFTANKAILAIISFNIVILYPSVGLYYKKRNESKEKKWSAMDHEQKNHCKRSVHFSANIGSDADLPELRQTWPQHRTKGQSGSTSDLFTSYDSHT